MQWLLECNGKASSSKGTKHIDVWYFSIDRIQMGEVHTEWCSTTQTIGDFMMKSLQSGLFVKFCELIMGVVPMKGADTVKKTSCKCMVHKKLCLMHHRSVLGK